MESFLRFLKRKIFFKGFFERVERLGCFLRCGSLRNVFDVFFKAFFQCFLVWRRGLGFFCSKGVLFSRGVLFFQRVFFFEGCFFFFEGCVFF